MSSSDRPWPVAVSPEPARIRTRRTRELKRGRWRERVRGNALSLVRRTDGCFAVHAQGRRQKTAVSRYTESDGTVMFSLSWTRNCDFSKPPSALCDRRGHLREKAVARYRGPSTSSRSSPGNQRQGTLFGLAPDGDARLFTAEPHHSGRAAPHIRGRSAPWWVSSRESFEALCHRGLPHGSPRSSVLLPRSGASASRSMTSTPEMTSTSSRLAASTPTTPSLAHYARKRKDGAAPPRPQVRRCSRAGPGLRTDGTGSDVLRPPPSSGRLPTRTRGPMVDADGLLQQPARAWNVALTAPVRHPRLPVGPAQAPGPLL